MQVLFIPGDVGQKSTRGVAIASSCTHVRRMVPDGLLPS